MSSEWDSSKRIGHEKSKKGVSTPKTLEQNPLWQEQNHSNQPITHISQFIRDIELRHQIDKLIPVFNEYYSNKYKQQKKEIDDAVALLNKRGFDVNNIEIEDAVAFFAKGGSDVNDQ